MRNDGLGITARGDAQLAYERDFEHYRQRARAERSAAIGAALAGIGRALAGLARDIVSANRRARLAAAASRDLRALDDRTLRDIGLDRADIPAVARALAARDTSGSPPTVAALLRESQEQTGRPTPRRSHDPQWRLAA